jgi:hypothetical protein
MVPAEQVQIGEGIFGQSGPDGLEPGDEEVLMVQV